MIRTATLDDLDALVEGNAAMALETEGLTLDPDVLRAGVRAALEGQARYLVLQRDGRVVAQLLQTTEWSDWRCRPVWWIHSVYVWPAYRRQGLFRALYAAVLAEAEAAGVAGVRLYVDERNTPAQAVYRSLGMVGDHYRVFEAMFD
ncbi:MAG: GNAT family N-acetyltransferase [Alphaproteobacteria bacterium]|nr:GNAT family N-acetyltransferase [Alphaproteobacteria bacterium]